MKKVFLLAITLIVALSSCDLNKQKEGSINSENAIEQLSDASNMRNYLYIALRGLYTGSNIYNNEISADLFHASYGFGNRGGTYHRWEWNSSDGDAQGIWQNCYYYTANANFLLDGIAKLEAVEGIAATDLATLKIYKGECYFIKAATMFELAQRFCSVYSQSTASSYGVMLADTYNPTSDASQYPGRATLEDTYKYIDNYIAKAEECLSDVKPEVGSMYLTRDAVLAMKARIALAKGDYPTAISASTAIVNSGAYPLLTKVADFNALWSEDTGKECIVQLYASFSPSSLPGSMQYGYVSENASHIFSPDFIPEQWVIDLYKEYPNDMRNNWFPVQTLTYGTIKGNAAICYKFPGNKSLQSESQSTSNYIHKIKPFRVAEQYLIAAEAYAKSGNDGEANKMLNALRAARIPDYIDQNYTGAELISEIKDERVRELFGEGFRLLDLKRYGDTFKRSAAQDNQIISEAGSSLTEFLEIKPDNFRYLFAIPQTEIDSNPQIKEQQNPGY